MKRYFLGAFVIISLTVLTIPLNAEKLYSSAYLMKLAYPQIDAMGGSAVATPLGVSSSIQNPATLGEINGFSVAFARNYHVIDENESLLGMAYSSRRFAIAFNGYIGTVKDIEARKSPTDTPDYTFDATQMTFSLSVAFSPTDYSTIGYTIRSLDEELDGDHLRTNVSDFGILLSFNRLNMGASIRNIGEKVRYDNIYFDLPLCYSIGISGKWRNFNGEMTYMKVDIVDANYIAAISYDLHRYVNLTSSLRLGHDSRTFTAGADFKYEGWVISYAFSPYGNGLGTRHSIGISN